MKQTRIVGQPPQKQFPHIGTWIKIKPKSSDKYVIVNELPQQQQQQIRQKYFDDKRIECLNSFGSNPSICMEMDVKTLEYKQFDVGYEYDPVQNGAQSICVSIFSEKLRNFF